MTISRLRVAISYFSTPSMPPRQQNLCLFRTAPFGRVPSPPATIHNERIIFKGDFS